jgi:hypothetical protein
MSGILDNKARIIDAIITVEGRRQLSSGELQVKYVTFSDATTFYEPDVVSGSADATTRIYLEAASLPSDQVIFEADDSGRLRPFKAGSQHALQSGQLISYGVTLLTSSVYSGSSKSLSVLSGSEFASTMGSLLTSSGDNFRRGYVLSTRESLLDDEGFYASPRKMSFVMTDTMPISQDQETCDVNQLESLFADPRLGLTDNFRYLPPVNKSPYTTKIGDYPPWSAVLTPDEAFSMLQNELSVYEANAYARSVTFDPTSLSNNLVGQVFEIGNDSATKLDVIEFGKFRNGDPRSPISHVFFAGKIVVDQQDNQSFVHLFTLIFE